jgi:dTDP-4-amino-4,6-dideoxygalactose transaminase
MIFRCDLVPQYELYKEELHNAIERVLLSGRYTLANEVRLFEEEYARYIGTKHAVGVGNATDGLILALKALGIGQGDEVITTPFTAIPTVSAIIASGATPVFTDILEDTFLMNLDQIKALITNKTKAIMPVHLFGNMVDIQALKSIVGSIPIIEDASQSHGSTLNGIQSGSMTELSVFSFYPTKNLGAVGDGGIVLTNDDALNEKLRLLRTYGMVDYNHIRINGVNSRLDELQAAILRVKLPHLDEFNRKRNHIASRYKNELRSDLFTHQHIPSGIYSNYHQFVSRLKVDRDLFIEYMDSKGIQTNIYYLMPLHLQEANQFLGYKKGDFPVAEKICNEVIALTMYPELDESTLDFIINTINQF